MSVIASLDNEPDPLKVTLRCSILKPAWLLRVLSSSASRSLWQLKTDILIHCVQSSHFIRLKHCFGTDKPMAIYILNQQKSIKKVTFESCLKAAFNWFRYLKPNINLTLEFCCVFTHPFNYSTGLCNQWSFWNTMAIRVLRSSQFSWKPGRIFFRCLQCKLNEKYWLLLLS